VTADRKPAHQQQTRYRVDVHHHFPEGLAALLTKGDQIMSVLSDKIAAVGSSLDAALGRVQGDVGTLTQKVAELEALVAAGGATLEDIAALEAIQAKLDALDPVKPETLPA
jgi:hypothetical protein